MMYPYFDGERQRIQAFKEQQPYLFWQCIGTVEKHFLLWKSLLTVDENSSEEVIAKACDDIDFLSSVIGNGPPQPHVSDYTVSFT